MNFREKTFQVVNQIPKGKVATYGQVAALAGSHRAARQVGWSLASLGLNEQKIPWWRVVDRKGYLSIRGDDPEAKIEQRSLLEEEGIEVSDELIIDLERYRWMHQVDSERI